MISKQIRLKKVETADKVELALSALQDSIINGNLEPGTELPPESEMARQLGVSKFSIREALRVAQAQGLIEISQGRRTRVADISVKPATGIINLILRRSENALLELTEARKCLECDIVRLAATRANQQHIEEMNLTILELEKNKNNLEYCVGKDLEFHKILVKSSRNKVFEIMLAPLAELLRQSRLETMRISGVDRAIEEHRQILDAIIKKDPELSDQRMREHLQTAEDNLTEIKSSKKEGRRQRK